MFLDSDDWLELVTVEYCLNKIKEYSVQIVEFKHRYVYNDSVATINLNDRDVYSIYENKDILQYYMQSTTDGSGSYSVCTCLFSKDLLEGLFFREGKINEDIDFKYKVLTRCKKQVVSNHSLYNYFQPGTSLSVGGLKRKDFDIYESAQMLLDLSLDENYGSIKYLAKVKYARNSLSLLCKIAMYGISDSSIKKVQVIEDLTRKLRKDFKFLLMSPIPLSRKLLTIAFCINYKVVEIPLTIYKKIKK